MTDGQYTETPIRGMVVLALVIVPMRGWSAGGGSASQIKIPLNTSLESSTNAAPKPGLDGNPSPRYVTVTLPSSARLVTAAVVPYPTTRAGTIPSCNASGGSVRAMWGRVI